MTQQVFKDIDPNVTSGTQLATILNQFKASLLTANSGPTAPTYALIGTNWLDTSVTDKLTMKHYDGSQWISEFTIDTVAHTISFGGNNPTASFTVSRTDTADEMLEMFRDTGVATNAGLIFSQINDNAIKKTFAKFKMVADNNTDTSEQGSFLWEAMIAGTMTTIGSLAHNSFQLKALEGTGNRTVKVDANGNFFAEAETGVSNIFGNGSADSADLGTYTVNAPLTLGKSSTAADLIDSTQVFQAIATAASETFETENISIPNGFGESPLITQLKYKSSSDWTVQLVDTTGADVNLKTVTLSAYSPTLNEAKLKKFFYKIPTTVTQVKLVFTSTAASTLFFDGIEFKSWATVDEPLHFEHSVGNNVTDEVMFDIANRKNKVLKVSGQIIRSTDTDLADGVVDFYISNNGTVNRIGKENIFDHEDTEIRISFNMNGDVLRLSSSDITGANYDGKFYGTIERIL